VMLHERLLEKIAALHTVSTQRSFVVLYAPAIAQFMAITLESLMYAPIAYV
jgi:uncharacterized membrane protein